MAYQINGVNIPSSIYNNGALLPLSNEALAINGQGESVASRIKKLVWRWSSLSKSDFEWWTQTILSNGLSLRCAARLPNETGVETAYTTVIVRKPVPTEFHTSRYYGIELVIEVLD